MREKWWFPVVYMFLITAFSSSIVIGFSYLTSARVEANENLAFEKAVLTVLPGLFNKEKSRSELHRIFTGKISNPDETSGGAYTLKDTGKIIAYALPISGQGFWAPIKGVIGINADRQTITGIYFYEQNETPGLGAQITKDAFRNQFNGKIISSTDKPINMMRPGTILGKSDVHAVTGATQTSTRLEKIINDALNNWSSEMNKTIERGRSQ
ncbi:MAG: FMN-binding protein [Sedimentisphaerales bacterium]|nr:FMN-binding protein [Sedimentisphaerales bacterium]